MNKNSLTCKTIENCKRHIVISTEVLVHPKNYLSAVARAVYWVLKFGGRMETERVKILAKSVDYGIEQVAAEHTKLLTQSFSYGSRDWCPSNANSKECIVQMPKQSAEKLYR